jgi:hypothetical protein
VTEAVAGAAILRTATVSTAAFVVLATAAAIAPGTLARPVAVVDGALFLAGVAAFAIAFARAVARSRTEEVDLLGMVFLGGGAAPPQVRRHLLGALAVQIVVAVVTASVRPYTSVAFGVLVPMLGVGLAALWGATHGTFPPRGERRHVTGARGDQADCDAHE